MVFFILPQSEYTVYPFSYGHPHSNYFISARVNPTDNDYLDIRLVGIADGWVAIGFSHTSTMVCDLDGHLHA